MELQIPTNFRFLISSMSLFPTQVLISIHQIYIKMMNVV